MLAPKWTSNKVRNFFKELTYKLYAVFAYTTQVLHDKVETQQKELDELKRKLQQVTNQQPCPFDKQKELAHAQKDLVFGWRHGNTLKVVHHKLLYVSGIDQVSFAADCE